METLENLCPRCGEPYSDRGGRLRCLTCGYIKPEKATKEEEVLLAAAAQKLRFADFDEAKELYADILETYPKNAEAHWGILLCEYGIKYESDYDGKKIATCYSTRYESFYDNPHYKKAIDFADDKQREYYKSQAEFIEKVRKEWIEKASKEKPYDIFLSFRDTIDGERTEDSYGAYDLYNYLTRLGYRVFFSRVTLKDKTGENYEPYIFNALNTAKVMLVYASKPEYVTSTWVKNEWTRYLSRIRAQEKRPDSLCLIIKGFNPSKLPASLKNRQLLKTEDLTYIKDLEAYLDKELKEAKITAPTIQRKEIAAKAKGAARTIESVETIDVKSASSVKKAHAKLEAVERRDIGNYVVPKLNATTESRITQAKYYLKAKDFARAEGLYEEALAEARENPKALLGLLLARSSCTSLDEWLSAKLETFDDFPLVIRVINYSDIDTVTALLDAYAAYITRLATELEWAKALELYKRFGNYDTPSINELPLTLLQDATNHIVGEGCPEFIDALLPYLKTDANAYKAALVSLGEACIREKFFEKAVIAFDTYAQYYDFDHKTFLLSLEAKKECRSLEELFHALCKENDFSLISKDVPLPKNELEKLFVVVTDFALGELGSHPQDVIPLISFLVRCNFSFREGFIKRGINYCCDFPSEAISGAFDAFLSSFGEGEEEKLIGAMMRFAKAALEIDGELTRKYLGRVSEYDPDNEDLCRLRVCVQGGLEDDDLSKGFRRELSDYSDIENLLSLRGSRTCFEVLKPFFDAVVNSPTSILVRTFDALCGYLPKEEDSALIPYIEEFSKACLTNGHLFEEAERYYALLVSLKPDDSKAYWGLLQAKLRCRNDDELIEQGIPLAELPEFENAKNSVGDDEAALSRYIDCELKQLKRQEEKEAERKRKAEEEAALEARRLKKKRDENAYKRKKEHSLLFFPRLQGSASPSL